MAEKTLEKLKFRTYEQSGETKLGVEFYSAPDELKAMQDLTETEAIELRDWLNTQYPAT